MFLRSNFTSWGVDKKRKNFFRHPLVRRAWMISSKNFEAEKYIWQLIFLIKLNNMSRGVNLRKGSKGSWTKPWSMPARLLVTVGFWQSTGMLFTTKSTHNWDSGFMPIIWGIMDYWIVCLLIDACPPPCSNNKIFFLNQEICIMTTW